MIFELVRSDPDWIGAIFQAPPFFAPAYSRYVIRFCLFSIFQRPRLPEETQVCACKLEMYITSN